ncbi:leucyl aminopeptidase [Marinithermus hydrothermalis]|uniref:Probable cytosol aminopeptidase n=1 Tax=Marinithermus hydrothermalis (strain DSM 14884 / JCM 11576 / T1) TaxID=869210 RepID=F2NNU7_MARHT|nr:leucyl aminopeptidase [Marinithermus hydrothermalis]AEB11321.1 cytosol aminopeptidase [Marinithermus hydrothermalis DSM 14884]
MNIRIKSARRKVFEIPAPLRVVGVLAGELTEEGVLLDRELAGALSETLKKTRFAGDFGETLLVKTEEGFAMLFGLGKKRGLTLEHVRRAGARLAQAVAATGLREAVVEAFLAERFGKKEVSYALAEGILLGGYAFNKYKTHARERKVRFILARAFGPAVERAQTVAEAVWYARDLVNEPPNVLTPAELARRAQALAEAHGLECEILGPEEIQARGMGAYLAVAQGSANPPHFIKLVYRPQGTPKRRVALVGKGMTFDTGGYSLKPRESMRSMKADMAGAAAVLGAVLAAARLGLEVEVRAYIAAAENMVSGAAYRVDDVIRAMNGKTIEVTNTDAEGRLTLADALAYASEEKPDAIVELSTLTGACVIALGEEIAGVFAADEGLGKRFVRAAEEAGEKVWLMPLDEDYRRILKSDVADLKNAGVRWGGAITAGLFLTEFATTPFVHVDIAGPAFAERPHALGPAGGTGFGVRSLVRFLEQETQA